MNRPTTCGWTLSALIAVAAAGCSSDSTAKLDAGDATVQSHTHDATVAHEGGDAGMVDPNLTSADDAATTTDSDGSLDTDGGSADGGDADGGVRTSSIAATVLGADLVPDPLTLEADLFLPGEGAFPADLLPPR